MTMRKRVLILGYGEMGHAMERLLKDRHSLDIWDKYPPQGFQSVVLEAVAPLADIVLFCLPVNPHREVAAVIAPLLKPEALCLSIAKGLDEAGQTAAQVFADIFAEKQPYALLYGPMISEEIRAGKPAFAQLGCVDLAIFQQIQALYQGSPMYLAHTTDITGISWSVILKNVYAMVFGMADELQLGDNMRGYLTVAALRELAQIVHLMGGELGSPYHLAGLGDLMTTATSEDSHHHELGRLLGRGETEDIRGEGVHTLAMVTEHQLFDTSPFALFELIRSIIAEPSDIDAKLAAYLQKVFGSGC